MLFPCCRLCKSVTDTPTRLRPPGRCVFSTAAACLTSDPSGAAGLRFARWAAPPAVRYVARCLLPLRTRGGSCTASALPALLRPAGCTIPWSPHPTTWARSSPLRWPSSMGGATSWQMHRMLAPCCARCRPRRWCSLRQGVVAGDGRCCGLRRSSSSGSGGHCRLPLQRCSQEGASSSRLRLPLLNPWLSAV